MWGSGCYKCGKTGHFRKDFIAPTTTIQKSDLIFFHCNHRGHKKAHCPSLAFGEPVKEPAPVTLHITDGRQGKADAPMVRSRAFQLSVEEARATPDVVTGLFLCLNSYFMLISILIFYVFF